MGKRGEVRYCVCGCGQPAKKIYNGDRFKSWRAYASEHAPNERIEIRIPENPIDLAYAAGIIDGEGCIYARVSIPKNTNSISTIIQLQVTMCSDAVVKWLTKNFGGNVFVSQPPSANRRVRFIWQIRGRKVGTILEAIEPYLKEKKIRARLGISLAKSLSESKVRNGNFLSSGEIESRQRTAFRIKEFNQSLRSEDFAIQ